VSGEWCMNTNGTTPPEPRPVVVVVATIMRPSGGTGVQTHFGAFLGWLDRRGHQGRLITPFDLPLLYIGPVFALRRVVHRFSTSASVAWYRYWHRWFLEIALRRQLTQMDECVVYAQCPVAAEAALRARSSARQRVVLVVHFNRSQADEWIGKGMIAEDSAQAAAIRAFESTIIPRLDGLVYVSEFMRREVQARIAGSLGVRSAVVPNFVADPGAVVPSGSRADLLTIGSLEPRKNQMYALQIVAAAHAAGYRLTLAIAGDGPERRGLEAEVRRLGLTDAVTFLGHVPDAASLFAGYRACLHTALVENLPLVLVEALCHGRPVFATPGGGVTEVFSDGAEGRYLPPDDPVQAAARIVEWLATPQRMEQAGRAARARFEAHFDSDVVAAQLTAFLYEVARQPDRPDRPVASC